MLSRLTTGPLGLFAPGSTRRFHWVVGGLALLMALRMVLWPYHRLAGQPPELFRPVYVLRFLDAMPAAWVLVAVQAAGVVAAFAAVATRGRRRWAAFVAAWLCYVVLAGLRGSLGKVLHNDVLLILAAVPFLWPVDDDNEADCGWPVRTAMAVIAAGYFIAGVAKARYSGVEWVTSDNMRYILSRGVIDGRTHFESWAGWVADRAWLSTAAAAGIMTLELGAPVAVALRRLRPAFVVAATALHVATWFLLGLDYWAWIGVVALVLVDWPSVAARLGHRRAGAPTPVSP